MEVLRTYLRDSLYSYSGKNGIGVGVRIDKSVEQYGVQKQNYTHGITWFLTKMERQFRVRRKIFSQIVLEHLDMLKESATLPHTIYQI